MDYSIAEEKGTAKVEGKTDKTRTRISICIAREINVFVIVQIQKKTSYTTYINMD